MAGQAEFKVILTIDSQGNAKIEEVKRSLEGVGTAADQANRQGAAGADEFAGALMRKLGVVALVTAGFYALERAAVGAFRAGIQAQDDFQLNTIGVAATLTDLGKEGANAQLNYANNLAYSRDMYNELELAAAHHFASGKDLIQGWNILAQKGVVLRKEEIEDLGIIVDKIKLATQGQVQGIQIAQELRAMLSGQSRQTDQMAMILRDRYGAEWEEIVKKHREAGDLLSWLAGEFKGLQYASQDVTGTLTAQKTTMETLLSQVGRQGLAGAYEDVVKWLSEGNDYLREHKNEIAYGIVVGWERTKELAGDVLKTVQTIGGIVATPVTWTINIGGTLGKFLAAGGGPLGDFGFGALGATGQEGAVAPKITTPSQTRILQAQHGGRRLMQTPYGLMEITDIPMDVETRKLAGDTGGGGGGGKSTEGALNSAQSLTDRLNQGIAKFSEGSLAAVDAYYDKTMNDIAKLGAKGVDTAELEALAWQEAGLKKGKIVDDFWLMVDKKTGQGFEAIDDRYLDDLNKYKDVQGAKEALLEIWKRDTFNLEQKQAKDIEDLRKSSLSVMAANAPMLSEQLGLQGLLLNVEIERKRLALEKKILDDDIPEAQAAELRGLHALAAQYEKQAQIRKGWETEGMGGWAKSWAFDRITGMDKRGLEEFKSYMDRAESFLGQSFGENAWLSMQGKKGDFKKLFADVMGSAFSDLNKRSFRTLFDAGAGLMSPKQAGGGAGGVGGMGADGQLLKAAQGLQKSSLGFNLNSAQFGLAAGGLLLSGIGIATNSQALVIAGTVLQLAGLAIQLYQALTATVATIGFTTAAVALTGSAVALDMAATALMIAAAVDSIPFFHTGGVVAHQGWLVAHNGLNLAADERRVIAQVGEPIFNRDAWRQIEGVYGSGAFDMFNSGRVPAVPVPVGGQGGGGVPKVENHHYHDNRVFKVDGVTLIIDKKITPAEADAMWRKVLKPAADRAGALFVKAGK